MEGVYLWGRRFIDAASPREHIQALKFSETWASQNILDLVPSSHRWSGGPQGSEERAARDPGEWIRRIRLRHPIGKVVKLNGRPTQRRCRRMGWGTQGCVVCTAD